MMKRIIAFIGLLVCVVNITSLHADTSPAPVTPNSTIVSPSPGIPATEKQEAMADILDIKANEAIGFDYRIVYIILGVIAALIVLGLLFFFVDRYLKRRKKQEVRTEPVIPPDVSALRELDALERGGFSDPRIFYFTLTAIVKAYFEGRFGIDAPEMTTEELLPKINDLSVDRQLATEVKDLLRRSDPVKFAGMAESKDRMVQDIAFVKSFVTRTTPVELPLEPSGKP